MTLPTCADGTPVCLSIPYEAGQSSALASFYMKERPAALLRAGTRHGHVAVHGAEAETADLGKLYQALRVRFIDV